MSDLIDKQAATQKTLNFIVEYLGGAFDEDFQKKLIERMNALPSAQPEIIRCKDCKHGSPNGRYGCRVYHYKKYETHDMKSDDFCSFAERRTDGSD